MEEGDDGDDDELSGDGIGDGDDTDCSEIGSAGNGAGLYYYYLNDWPCDDTATLMSPQITEL